MTDFNKRLASSLDKDDEAFLQDLEGGRGIFTQIAATFRGPMAYMTVGAMTVAIIFFGLMIWTGWHALEADNAHSAALWSAGFIASLIPHGLLRLWLLQRAAHLALLREIKKIELRLIKLDERLA